MEVTADFHMNGGNGDCSYAKNSSIQSKIITLAYQVMEEAVLEILKNISPDNKIMAIVDLGCSSGPSVFSTISKIIDIVETNCELLGRDSPELILYMNDLFSNDFNNVFSYLPKFLKNKNIASPHCCVMGVAGSFYGRLFPTNSLHFAYSFSSLHWLSKVPEDLQNGKVMNMEKIYISKTSLCCILDAYALQFSKDFSMFLKSRSMEIVNGGGMTLSFMGRRPMEPPNADSCCIHWDLLAQSLMDMVIKGYIEKEKIDTFNVPYYAPSPEELRDEIEKEGSFMIRNLKVFEVDWQEEEGKDNNNSWIKGMRYARTIRAVVETMFESHFGREVIDSLFEQFGVILGTHLSKKRGFLINLTVSLVKHK